MGFIMNSTFNHSNSHYATHFKSQKIKSLVKALLEENELTLKSLAGIDQLHVGGLRATLSLLESIQLTKDSLVLEIGSGIGGTARWIEHQHQSCVISIENSAEFCQTAQLLNDCLSNNVITLRGDGQVLPFSAEAVDMVLLQHVLPNIENKEVLVNEIQRVLKPGGQLVIHEVFAGETGSLHYPVPWASTADQSYMIKVEDFISLCKQAHLTKSFWQDVSQDSLLWYKKLRERSHKHAVNKLNIELIFGDKFSNMTDNIIATLESDSIKVFRGIFTKKA
jgi:ubiquinone/menaquinone biosynthesis C-methylase UbiE